MSMAMAMLNIFLFGTLKDLVISFRGSVRRKYI